MSKLLTFTAADAAVNAMATVANAAGCEGLLMRLLSVRTRR